MDFLHRIDGSHLEGGGQVLRMSMGFAALLGKAVLVHDVRGKRAKPGLKAQHLAGIRLVREIVHGQLRGDELHSNEIEFKPKIDGDSPKKSDFSADTGTAGATTLLAQISLPCLLFSKTRMTATLRGGTDAEMAPPVDYMKNVLAPNLRRFGASFDCIVNRKGYFPRGGGEIVLVVDAPLREALQPVDLTDAGVVNGIRISASVAGKLPKRLAEEMADAARKILLKKYDNVDITTEAFVEPKAFGNGSSIFIKAETSTGCVLGSSAIGNPKVKPWKTGEKAALELLESLSSGACVDQWMQDQLIMYMALARGKSRVRTGALTLHTRTAIHVSQTLSHAKFDVIADQDNFVIECIGIGFRPELTT